MSAERVNFSDPVSGALTYAGRGWPVFPCKPDLKEPATAHGFKDASTDPELIRCWWTRMPTANVAIATGAPGPDVLDVDVRDDGNGWSAYNRLTRAGLVTGARALVQTRSGGLHAYYEGTDQGCGSLRGQYLDFKARGGYVLAPPSVVDGRAYALLDERDGRGHLNWSAVRRLIEPGPPPRPRHRLPVAGRDVGPLARWLAGQREGNRNKALYWACRRAVEDGLAEHLDHLVAAAVAAGETEMAARRTAESARGAYRGTP